jgi:hypothetical protein
MENIYLYIAQCTTDTKAMKHNVYKVGCSKYPEKRVRMLSGAASTNVYRLVIKLKLPTGIKDHHILAHKQLQPYVLYNNLIHQSQYIKIYGKRHEPGLQRRRELVMFGQKFSEHKVICMVRRIVKSIVNKTNNTYICNDPMCITATGSTTTSLCVMCTKYTQSIWNCITYHKVHNQSYNKIQSDKIKLMLQLDKTFTDRIHHNRTIQEYTTPNIGEFWLYCPLQHRYDNHNMIQLACIKSFDTTNNNESVRVQWWSSIRKQKTISGFVSSVFVQESRDGEPYNNLDTVHLKDTGWQCLIRMKNGHRKGYKLIFKQDRNNIIVHLKDYIKFYKLKQKSKKKCVK